MLENNNDNEEVKMLMMNVMGVSFDPPSAKSQSQSCNTVKDIHTYMLQELTIFLEGFKQRPDKAKYEPKNVVIATQALLNSKVYTKYNLTSEEVEGAIKVHQQELQQDAHFIQVTRQMQMAMEMLLSDEGGA